MDKLKAAKLTGSLLATKGSATPAMPGASSETLVRLRSFGAWPRRDAAKNGGARSPGKSARARGKRAAASGEQAADGTKTVNVSFRLESDRHLRLKLLATHFHKSMRECLEDAVEFYLASSGPAVRGGGCPCVDERGDPDNQPFSKECV